MRKTACEPDLVAMYDVRSDKEKATRYRTCVRDGQGRRYRDRTRSYKGRTGRHERAARQHGSGESVVRAPRPAEEMGRGDQRAVHRADSRDSRPPLNRSRRNDPLRLQGGGRRRVVVVNIVRMINDGSWNRTRD